MTQPDLSYNNVPGIYTEFNFAGMFFKNINPNETEGFGYPVITTKLIKSTAITTVTFSIFQEFCSDQGIAFFNANNTPLWRWEPNNSRIAFQINCGRPYLYGRHSEISSEITLDLNSFYTFQIIYNPINSTITANIYDIDLNGTLLDTISLSNEKLDSNYKIAFSADMDVMDQDENNTEAYFLFGPFWGGEFNLDVNTTYASICTTEYNCQGDCTEMKEYYPENNKFVQNYSPKPALVPAITVCNQNL